MLTKAVPFYEERYLIKPGATGWAQLQKSYYSSVPDTMEKLQYDLYYIKNRSVVFDLGILLRTISLVLRGFGR
jgi:lipopolysaccharide/colanic/teichoic acid biosynthesis glycosyltransferase